MALIQLIKNVDRLSNDSDNLIKIFNKLLQNTEDEYKILHIGYMQDMFYVKDKIKQSSNVEQITAWLSNNTDFFHDDYMKNIDHQKNNGKFISNFNGNQNISDFWFHENKIRLVFVRGENNKGKERWYLDEEGRIFLKTEIHLESNGYVTDVFRIRMNGKEQKFFSEEELIYFYLNQVVHDDDILITDDLSLVDVVINYFGHTVGKFFSVNKVLTEVKKIKQYIFLVEGLVTDSKEIYDQLVSEYSFKESELYLIQDSSIPLKRNPVLKRLSMKVIKFNNSMTKLNLSSEVIKLEHEFHTEKLLSGAGNRPGLVNVLNKLAGEDYILYRGTMKAAWFIKRRLYDSRQLKRYKDVFYQLDIPGTKRTTKKENKLVVFFLSLPPVEGLISNDPQDRSFTEMFLSIQRSLVKDTFVLRIADLNLVRGSFYVNSANFQDYEEQIQSLIRSVMSDNDIKLDNVVTYGVSRGGVGALVHGACLNSRIVAVDPIVNDEYYVKYKQDVHYVGQNREMDLTGKVESYLKNSTASGVIISNHFVKNNWEYLKNLNLDNKLKLIDVNDETVTEHPVLSRNTVPEQLMYLNQLLLDVKEM